MAGVSVQAFRRQGRRYGAGLVCSEMVSVAGIQHRNERTLGYLRVSLGRASRWRSRSSAPTRWRWPRRRGWSRPPGADIVDINFGCPVKQGHEDGRRRLAARRSRPRVPDRSRPSATADAAAGLGEDAARGRERLARRAWTSARASCEAGAASLTLHPRSAKQMYTGGVADHSLTAELVSLVDVPVIASGDVTSRGKAQAVLCGDRRGRGHGRPIGTGQPVDAGARSWATRPRAVARGGRRGAAALHPRDGARARRAARVRLPEEVLRLVPRSRPLPAAVQAGARDAADARPRWSSGCSQRRPARASVLRAAGRRGARSAATRCCSTRCRSRSTAAAS